MSLLRSFSSLGIKQQVLRRRIAPAVAATSSLVLVLTLASCGGAGSGSGNGEKDKGSEAAASAAAAVEKYAQKPDGIGLTKALSASPAGKSVVYLECSVANCKKHAEALVPAFSALGVNFKRVNSGLSPEEFRDAFETAKQLAPDGVIYDAVPASIAQRYADEFASKGIPVVGIASPDLRLGENIHNVEGPGFYEAMGRLMADWATVQVQGAGEILYLKDPTLAFGEPETKGFLDNLDKRCPKCEVDVLETNSGAAGSTLPADVVGHLQRAPKTKVVVAQYSALLLGVPSALKTSGIEKVKTIGFGATTINQEAIKRGHETAGVLQSDEALSWFAADTMARALVGDPVDTEIVANPPIVQLAEKGDISWNPDDDWPYIDGWQQDFKTLWSVK